MDYQEAERRSNGQEFAHIVAIGQLSGASPAPT